MDNHKHIIEFIQDYQRRVDFVVKVFRHKYNTTDLLASWHQGVYKQDGNIKEFEIKKYYFHGIGLAAKLKGVWVDFDFGGETEMRHDGFDEWRLHKFAEEVPTKYMQFTDKKILHNQFSQLINDGFIFKPETKYNETLYFFKDMKLIADVGPIDFDRIRKPWWKIF